MSEDKVVVSCLVCDEDLAPGCVDEEHARASERRAAATVGQWSPLVLGEQDTGGRHYLDGVPVHCGGFLELQSIVTRYDDCGSWSEPQQHGQIARYEIERVGGSWSPVLYVYPGGHEAQICFRSYMRFRWPKGGS